MMNKKKCSAANLEDKKKSILYLGERDDKKFMHSFTSISIEDFLCFGLYKNVVRRGSILIDFRCLTGGIRKPQKLLEDI